MHLLHKGNRFVEIYAGSYASGKSETAINRARQFSIQHKPITLVDLDTVEPAYNLRHLAGELEAEGINVITQLHYYGADEAAKYINSEQKNCLKINGNVIIDVGHGPSGLDMLNVIRNLKKEKNIRVYLVVNSFQFKDLSPEEIALHYESIMRDKKTSWIKISGFISNTNSGSETTKEEVIMGYETLKKVSKKVGIPIIAIGVDESLVSEFDFTYDSVEVWIYRRYMPKVFI